MSRLAAAVLAVVDDLSGGELAEVLAVPKRTADRWLAELRDHRDLTNWSGVVLERLARWEASEWGTHRIADGLHPVEAKAQIQGKADAGAVARIMQSIITSHQVNATLLGEMATDLSDGVLHDHEARRLLPLVEQAQQTAMVKHRALSELQQLLENRLGGPSGVPPTTR